MKAYLKKSNIMNILKHILPHQRPDYQNNFPKLQFVFSFETSILSKNRCKLQRKLCNTKMYPLEVTISAFRDKKIQQSLRTKKLCNLSGHKKNYATSRGPKKITQLFGTKKSRYLSGQKVMQPLGTKKSRNLLGQKKLRKPLG